MINPSKHWRQKERIEIIRDKCFYLIDTHTNDIELCTRLDDILKLLDQSAFFLEINRERLVEGGIYGTRTIKTK